MKFRLQEIAQMLEGHLKGDGEIEVSKLTKIDEEEGGGLTFLFSPAYLSYLDKTKAAAIIISEHLLPKEQDNKNLIVVKDAYQSFVRLLDMYNNLLHANRKVEISKKAEIHESAKIAKNVSIGSFVVIEEGVVIADSVHIYPNVFIGKNSIIGEGTIIHPGAVLYSDSIIGKNCIIHSGVIIGSDGFGFIPNKNGEYKKIPQLGNVIIEDEVEVGANSTIDRATLGSTIIRSGVKLDNQIQIAHNVEINKNTVIASQSGIAGSTKIGENVVIGGQVGIAGHISIPDGVKIQAKSGVNSSPKKGVKQLYGSPAFEATGYRKAYIYFKKFPQLAKKIEELEKALSK